MLELKMVPKEKVTSHFLFITTGFTALIMELRLKFCGTAVVDQLKSSKVVK